jgi:Transposase DNA-binding/Transposase Tn5 dimerisation domain
MLPEMDGLDLGDARLERRATKVLTAMSVAPGASLPRACSGHADLIGAYRLFDNEAVTLPQLLAGHRAATLARAAAEPVVLAVQDSTWLDYGTHRACTGLGAHTHGNERGLLAHTSVLVSGTGAVLGTLAVTTLVHARGSQGARPDRHRPARERQSYRWIEAHQTAMAQAVAQAHVTWLSVQDREGDLYALFAQPRPANGHWLVRVHHDRPTRTADAAAVAGLRARAAQAPVLGTMLVAVPPKPGRPARTATLQLHAQRVQLQPPRQSAAQRAVAALPPQAATLVWAHEPDAPAGQTPIAWLLLTSLPVADLAAAQQVVRWYACRWRIEEFFRVLKSETAVEDLQLGTRRRLEAALGLHLILTWRICTLRDQARAQPAAPCTRLFTPPEWQALSLLVTDAIPDQPPTLGTAVALLARLGGYLARRSDGPPGHRTIARGLRTLHAALRLAEKLRPDWRHQDV